MSASVWRKWTPALSSGQVHICLSLGAMESMKEGQVHVCHMHCKVFQISTCPCMLLRALYCGCMSCFRILMRACQKGKLGQVPGPACPCEHCTEPVAAAAAAGAAAPVVARRSASASSGAHPAPECVAAAAYPLGSGSSCAAAVRTASPACTLGRCCSGTSGGA